MIVWCFLCAGFCLCCGTENVEIFHPLFKGSLCLKCKVRDVLTNSRVSSEAVNWSMSSSFCRTTLQRPCFVTMKMDTSRTAPSAAMEWRSYCVGTTAAAGPALRFSVCHRDRKRVLLLPLTVILLLQVVLRGLSEHPCGCRDIWFAEAVRAVDLLPLSASPAPRRSGSKRGLERSRSGVIRQH